MVLELSVRPRVAAVSTRRGPGVLRRLQTFSSLAIGCWCVLFFRFRPSNDPYLRNNGDRLAAEKGLRGILRFPRSTTPRRSARLPYARNARQPAPANIGYIAGRRTVGTAACFGGLRWRGGTITKIQRRGHFLLLLGAVRHTPIAVAGRRRRNCSILRRISRSCRRAVWPGISTAAMGAKCVLHLSIGIGSSIGHFRAVTSTGQHSLSKEALIIIRAGHAGRAVGGCVIFPACVSYGVEPGAGPGLIFVSLPNVFNHMPGGRWWEAAFFLFLSVAALTTVIAVFENLIAFMIDE